MSWELAVSHWDRGETFGLFHLAAFILDWIRADDIRWNSINSYDRRVWAREMCENAFPCFWSMLSQTSTVARGKRLKQPVAPPVSRPRCVYVAEDEAVKPPCLWARNPNITHRLQRFLSGPADLNLSALSFLGAFPSCCRLWSLWAVKSSWQKYERCLCNLLLPPRRHEWGLQSTLGDPWGWLEGGCFGWRTNRALHGTGSGQ